MIPNGGPVGSIKLSSELFSKTSSALSRVAVGCFSSFSTLLLHRTNENHLIFDNIVILHDGIFSLS